MRTRWFLLLVPFSVSLFSFAGERTITMHDPLLGLPYDTKVIHFERAPEEFCRAHKRWCNPCWVYAVFDDGPRSKNRYMIMAGLADPLEDPWVKRDYRERIPDQGGVYVFDGKEYELVLAGDDLNFSEHVSSLPSGVFAGLMRDGSERLMRAFGGREAVQNAINKVKRPDFTMYGPKYDAFRDLGFVLPCNERAPKCRYLYVEKR